MIYTDRSRTEADWVCPRSRYWQYHYNGKGIVSVEPQEELEFGLRIAHNVEITRGSLQHVMNTGPQTDADTLVIGLTLAYDSYIWPDFVRDYELIATELECSLELASDIIYMARPDAVLKRRSDGTFWYLEDKTTSQQTDNWLRQWDKAVQLHATAVAIEKQLDITVQGCLVQGWYKGYKSKGTIYSPLCYAWAKEGVVGLTPTQWSPTYKAGWIRQRVDEYPGGIEAWIKKLPIELVRQQFPLAGPVMVRRDLVEAYFKQVIRREQVIHYSICTTGSEYAPIVYPEISFPQHFSNCDEYGKFRRPCAYKDCCWAPSVGRDPVGSGLYTFRRPHHDVELRACQEKDLEVDTKNQ